MREKRDLKFDVQSQNFRKPRTQNSKPSLVSRGYPVLLQRLLVHEKHNMDLYDVKDQQMIWRLSKSLAKL